MAGQQSPSVLAIVFAVLAVVHLAVLPIVLSERLDDWVAVGAGAFYLVLAALAWRPKRDSR